MGWVPIGPPHISSPPPPPPKIGRCQSTIGGISVKEFQRAMTCLFRDLINDNCDGCGAPLKQLIKCEYCGRKYDI